MESDEGIVYCHYRHVFDLTEATRRIGMNYLSLPGSLVVVARTEVEKQRGHLETAMRALDAIEKGERSHDG